MPLPPNIHENKNSTPNTKGREQRKGGGGREKMGISEVKKRGLISVQKDKAILCCSVFTVFGVKNM